MQGKADSVSLYRIRRILRELSNKSGRGTELISLYVPPKKPIHEVTSALRDEQGTASNIKSDQTRNHVQEALVKTMQRLKLYREVPDNGLVIFCGALATNGPGSEVVELYEVLPTKQVETYLYRCDDHFQLDPLREMLKEERAIGILSLDTTEAGLGVIMGSKFEVADLVTSGVSGKHRAGGQSARRFERLREMEISDYFRLLAEHAKRVFLELYRVEALIVGGPGHTKQDFLKSGYLDYRLDKAVRAVVDTSYAGREGARETLDRSTKVLEDIRLMEERKLVQRFLQETNSQRGLAVYGLTDVQDALLRGNVDTVLVSEDIGITKIQATCKRCGTASIMFSSERSYFSDKQSRLGTACERCGATEWAIGEVDVVDHLDELRTPTGAKLEVISSKSEEGAMLESFGGVAAILRFKS